MIARLLSIVCVVLLCNPGSELFAAPTEIQSAESIASQLIGKDNLSNTHLVTGEALVGLLKQVVDFETEGSSLVFHRSSGKLFVKNTPKNQAQVKNILQKIREKEVQQVMIEARIVEVASFSGFDIGVDWTNINAEDGSNQHSISGNIGLPAGSFGDDRTLSAATSLNLTYGFLKSPHQLDVTLRALEREDKVNTLASPKLICFNNQRANIKIEDTTDYVSKITSSTVFTDGNIDVNNDVDVDTAVEGIVLDVTPSISTDNQSITLDLHPEVVELVSLTPVTLTDGTISLPKFVRRTADTTVKIKDGMTVVIGGLTKRTESNDVRKVPFLGDVPLIKNLFRTETKFEEKSSLLIFITAKIVDYPVSSI